MGKVFKHTVQDDNRQVIRHDQLDDTLWDQEENPDLPEDIEDALIKLEQKTHRRTRLHQRSKPTHDWQ